MRKILFIVILTFSANVFCDTAIPARVIGNEYKAKGVNVRLIYLGKKKQQSYFGVSSQLDSKDCRGEITGLATYNSNILAFEPFEKMKFIDERCVVKILFRKNGQSAIIEERNCEHYRSRNCSWNKLLLDRAQ